MECLVCLRYVRAGCLLRRRLSTQILQEGKRYNVTFVLSLSDLVNIYSVYHDLTNLLQEVIIIPFDQIEKF